MSSAIENLLLKTWHERNALSILLRPLSWLYCGLVFLRRLAYRARLFRSVKMPVPVIVAGNLTVGGTGKTPLVIHLAEVFKQAGYQPGIVSRGYRGKARSWPQQVRPDGDPVIVGDEAILISRRTQCPMAVGPDRVAAAQALLKYHDCDLIISDDGLQHYALKRNIEIAIIDGNRRFGNGFCLPAGPLREPVKRLASVDFVMTNGPAVKNEISFSYDFLELVSLSDNEKRSSLSDKKNSKVHAIAGIGNPDRFFELLRNQGIDVIEHVFPDHHHYYESDLVFDDEYPVIMTEKDAVKCFRYASKNMWYLPVSMNVSSAFDEDIKRAVNALI